MRLVTVKMPEVYVRGIDELVKARRYSSRSEVIRIAVRELLKRELWGGYTGFPEPVRIEVPPAYRPNVLKGVGLNGEADEDLEGVEAVEIEV